MSESIYCVYKHTIPSGKSYIGQTKNYYARTIRHKKAKSQCHAFSNAVNKYGWDNFTHEILKENLTIDEANYWEELLIKEFNTLYPNGYNLIYGGKNRSVVDATKEKMRISALNRGESPLKGIPRSEETKLKLSIAGKNMSKEKRDRIQAGKGIYVCSEETKLKISLSFKDRKNHSIFELLTTQ